MPGQDSPSPAPRPALDQRNSSSHAAPKGSPTSGHLSKSHKGSSTKLHKAHPVGHGRHPHPRVPSHGKGLHKLSKLTAGETSDSASHIKSHNKSDSQTPEGSPTTQNTKRNSSQISLPRIGSKVSIKRNSSGVSMAKLGNKSKSEKAQTKNNLRKKGTDDVPVKGVGTFSVGEDGQEDDWEEASSSQSPLTTRHSSVGRKTPQLEDPPSPDDPPGRSPTNLPQSPPQSPPMNPPALIERTNGNSQQKTSKYSHPLDGDEVSHRLLDRSRHNVNPTVSNISATITPSGSSGSPAFSNQEPTFAKEPSMPADGISRFLGSTSSNSGSGTPGSISHLQSNLSHLNHKHRRSPQRPVSPADSTTAKPDARRVKSAANLTHPRLSNGESSSSLSPPKPPQPSNQRTAKSTQISSISPYESARGADPTAGKSLTQLKLDLQRMSILQDNPSISHPLMFQHGSVLSNQNLNPTTGEMVARLRRQHQQSDIEYKSAQRFHPDLNLQKGLPKKAEVVKKKLEGLKGKGPAVRTPASSTSPVVSSNSVARGRVRFEVGRSPGDGSDGHEGMGQGENVGVEGLTSRMWHHGALDMVLVDY